MSIWVFGYLGIKSERVVGKIKREKRRMKEEEKVLRKERST